MISPAVCALRTLAFMLDAARLAAAAKAARSGDGRHPLGTRTVTSYLLDGLFMPGTGSVIGDISGADLVGSIVLLGAGRLRHLCWPVSRRLHRADHGSG